MTEKDFVQILQYYQHDLMNEFQVIHGYLSMNKLDVAQDKMNDFIKHFKEVRKFIHIKAPKFILWIIQFNHQYEHIQLTYQIKNEHLNLEKIDVQLVEQCKRMVQEISMLGDQTKLYQIDLQIDQKIATEVTVICTVLGEFECKADVMSIGEKNKQNSPINIKEINDGFIAEMIFYME